MLCTHVLRRRGGAATSCDGQVGMLAATGSSHDTPSVTVAAPGDKIGKAVNHMSCADFGSISHSAAPHLAQDSSFEPPAVASQNGKNHRKNPICPAVFRSSACASQGPDVFEPMYVTCSVGAFASEQPLQSNLDRTWSLDEAQLQHVAFRSVSSRAALELRRRTAEGNRLLRGLASICEFLCRRAS